MSAIDESTQVTVVFTTKSVDPDLRVPSEPVTIPSRLGRKGLGSVLNLLLKRDETTAIKWDFAIDGECLRTTLKKFMKRKALSEEAKLTIEYFEFPDEPKQTDALDHPDCALKAVELMSH